MNSENTYFIDSYITLEREFVCSKVNCMHLWKWMTEKEKYKALTLVHEFCSQKELSELLLNSCY